MEKDKKSRKQITLTEHECIMLERGFVSIRMASAKTKRHKTTLGRAARLKKIEAEEIGGTYFLKIESLKKYLGGGAATEVFGLDDWSNVEFT